ncbi:MAG: hypothetical protein ACOC32_05065 [Nanoarchaeota archaeon]
MHEPYDEVTITKKISKMGDNHILIIPKDLRDRIQVKDLVQVSIKVLRREEKKPETKQKRPASPKKSTKTSPAKQAKKTPEPEPKLSDAEKKLAHIIASLVKQGYSFANIRKVLSKNGYKEADIDKVSRTIK